MAEWFEHAFGATADAAKQALFDVRASLGDELIARGWFGRNPMPGGQGDSLGWFREEAPGDAPSLLDRLYATNSELFSIEPGDTDRGAAPEAEHGFDR
jgi:hypothetical protein